MIKLITGQPGHRKTVYALEQAMKFKKEGRNVYVHGVRDLDYDRTGFKVLEDPTKWEDLPDSSVVFIDECYSTFPNRNPCSKVPPHVDAMARHRHRGFDFLLVAQQPIQLDPFLRGLYDEHVHCKKRWGKGPTRLHRWPQYQNNINGVCANISTYLPAKETFQVYTSTVDDTTKWRVPTWAKYAVVALVLVCGLTWVAKRKFDPETHQKPGGPARVAAEGGVGAPGQRPQWNTPAEYAKAHLPRFATLPWTAPIYDGRAVVADPEIICASSEAGLDANGKHSPASCTCLSEQGAKYQIAEAECRTIARDGRAYNPYSNRRLAQLQQQQQAQPSPAGTSMAATAAGVDSPTGIGSEGFEGAQQRYGQFRSDPIPADPGLTGG